MFEMLGKTYDSDIINDINNILAMLFLFPLRRNLFCYCIFSYIMILMFEETWKFRKETKKQIHKLLIVFSGSCQFLKVDFGTSNMSN